MTFNGLYWTTASEINSDYFDVEYSKDGFNFEGIGNVAAQGESAIQVDYRLIHEEPSDIAYYRLKMVPTQRRDLGKKHMVDLLLPLTLR